MSIIDNKKIFYINSKERATGTHSDFTYQLNITSHDEFNKACVLQCLIPKSYWLIQEGFNTFTLDENGSTATIIVPKGNYNRRSFASAIQTLLNNNSPNSWVYTVTFPNASTSADTGFYKWSVVGNSTQPSFIIGKNLYEQLGFDRDSTNTFANNELTSANVIKLQLEDALYLHSDMCNNGGNDNILQEVFASVGSSNFSNIHYQNAGNIEAYSKDLFPHPNNVYRFYLTDEDNRGIELNGQNIIIVLLLYKKNEIMDNFAKLIAYQFTKK